MEDFNIYGWSAIHEASYKGYSNAVSRFINYARDTQKMYLIELKTIDDLKATPLLIATLGGHLECVRILIDAGATLNETIKYKGKYFHGVIEIAIIRQDINVIMYFYENYNSVLKICERICNLMKNEENDDEIRASIGRTLELVTDRAYRRGLEAKLRDELVEYADFGRIYTLFIKYSRKNDESLASGILTMLNIFYVDKIRDMFNTNSGISYLIESLDTQSGILKEQFRKRNSDEDDILTAETILKSLEAFDDCNLIIASLGKAFAELTNYNDCIKVMVKESYGEKVIEFVKLLFNANTLHKKLLNEATRLRLNRDNRIKKVILFEQYIHPYLKSVGNLVSAEQFYRLCFNQSYLYEYVINLWQLIQPMTLNFQARAESRCVSSTSSSHYHKAPPRKSTRASLILPSIEDTLKKFVPFEFVPLKYNETATSSVIEPAMTPNLVKLLKLAIIECVGKVFYQNVELKKAYLYSTGGEFKYLNKNKNWYHLTGAFISTLVEFLDPNRSVEKEIRLEIMQFLVNIFHGDQLAIEKILDFNNASKSSLIICLRNLIRKSCALQLREEAMRTIWSIAGANDIYHTQKEKLVIYKAIGTQKFVDCVCDSDYLSLMALQALQVIASGPPFRELKLIKGTEEVKRVHAIPAIIRLLKIKDEEILYNLLRTISSFCVSTGYDNHHKNQLTFADLGTIQVVNDIAQKRVNGHKRLKYKAYLTLSSLSLNNSTVRKMVYKNFTQEALGLIHNLLMMLMGIDDGNMNLPLTMDDDELDRIEYRIHAGLAIAAFSYRNEEFRHQLVSTYDKIPWSAYTDILDYLLMQENRTPRSSSDKYVRVIRLKCLLAFQMGALYSIIDSRSDDSDEEDPRAVGIKILIDLVQYSTNSFIRTLAADCICRLINLDRTLVEPLVTVDAVEILCRQLEACNSKTKIVGNEITENELGNCSITLAHLVELSAEARRRILKLARKVPNIMKYLKYFNKTLHMDLLEQWQHYEKLMDMAKKKHPLNRKPERLLPLINNNSNKKTKVIVIDSTAV